MSLLSCVQQTSACSCPDFCVFTRLSSYIQIFVRLCPDVRTITRLLCVHNQTFANSSESSHVHVQTFLRSPDFRNSTRLSCFFSRFSCDHQNFLRSCPDFNSFTRFLRAQKFLRVYVQTFVCSCPDFCVLTRPSSFNQTCVR